MAHLKLIPVYIVVILSLIVSRLNKSITDIADVDKCPYCYGTDYCDVLLRPELSLRKDSLLMFFNNHFSTKNVFITTDNLVIKKLGSRDTFVEFDRRQCFGKGIGNCNNDDYASNIVEALSNKSDDVVDNFKLCGGANEFLRYLLVLKPINMSFEDYYKQLWTMININVEPIILQMLKSEDGWPVPRYFGACGRLIAEEYCGSTLNHFRNHLWLHRAYLALQLLRAAHHFTEKHGDFRFYLTDISPDNVAVNEDLKLKIIDLGNVIITRKTDGRYQHHTKIYGNDDYSFSENDLCNSSVSDHNYFSICKLLLSKNAPWPMMENGLLHSMPVDVQLNYPELQELIEQCVVPIERMTRFEIFETLVKMLQQILEDHAYFE